jgi:hypothetical protein
MPEDAPVAQPPLPAARDRRSSIRATPLFAWLALQMLALLAGGLRIPLSARFPAPAEQMAVYEMIVVQTAASALLFPALFPTLANGVLAAVSVSVMLLLAALLASRAPDARLLAVTGYLMIWVVGLAIWAKLLRTPASKLYGTALAALLVLGGAVVAYLGREFGMPGESFDWSARGWLGPMVGAITLMESGPMTGTPWAFLGSGVIATLFGVGVGWRMGAKAGSRA